MKKSKFKKILSKKLKELDKYKTPQLVKMESWNESRFMEIIDDDKERIDKLIIGLSKIKDLSKCSIHIDEDRINLNVNNYSFTIIKGVGLIIDKLLEPGITLRFMYKDCYEKLYSDIKQNQNINNLNAFNEIFKDVMTSNNLYRDYSLDKILDS